MEIKKTTTTEREDITRPSREDTVRARAEKKATKKEKVERARQREQNNFTEGYLRATAKSDVDYAVDRHISRPEFQPSSRLHPGTLAFLKKTRHSAFEAMKLQGDDNRAEKESSEISSKISPPLSSSPKTNNE